MFLVPLLEGLGNGKIDSLLAYCESDCLFLLHKRKVNEWWGSVIFRDLRRTSCQAKVTCSQWLEHSLLPWSIGLGLIWHCYFSPCHRQAFSVVKLAMTSHRGNEWLKASEATLRVVTSFGAPSPKTVLFRTRLPVGVYFGLWVIMVKLRKMRQFSLGKKLPWNN